MAKNSLLSPSDVETLVENGHMIVILGKLVLKLDAWIHYHPGGEKSIQHLVGKDATDEINAFHSAAAKEKMVRFQIGILEQKWSNLIPPIQQAGKEHNIQETSDNSTLPEKDLDMMTKSFREFIDTLEREGLFDCNYWSYFTEVIRIVLIFTLMLFLLLAGWYCTSAVVMGCFWHQLVFVAHDAGHMGITHSYHIDTMIGMIVANHIGGLSLGWWKRSHNIHHLVTNSPSHDPDIEHLPFLAISPSFFKSLYSTYYDKVMPYTKLAQVFIPYQAWLYYFFLSFGRFNLYVLSWDYIFHDLGPRSNKWHRLFEISGHVFFWTWFGYFLLYLSIPTWSLRIAFIMISHMVTMPLHCQFTLSHFAMATTRTGPNEPWPQQQLRTTMDVDCPTWLDWFHGGLQFQAVHHLFPRMPRHNLRKASGYVREWSKSVDLKYEIYGFQECNGRVLGRLAEVARQARFLNECQRHIIDKADFVRGEWEY
ncbi:fatty acid desaturas-like protein [Tricladium varicosporioides]|nr:fatty acid desaturas-like protein [Hymenoscyphus varicosporioides]